jgi:hypothetical protein
VDPVNGKSALRVVHSRYGGATERNCSTGSQDNVLMSAPITLKPEGAEVGAVRLLFRFNNAVGTVGIISPYDVSADGQRFVLITTPEQAPRPITLVTNWTGDLKP